MQIGQLKGKAMKRLACALLLCMISSIARAQYAPLPTTGTLSGLQAVTDMNTNFAAIFAAAPCGDSTHALAATTTGFTCQTLASGSVALNVTASAINYSGVMAATTTGSLATVYSAASYTYNPSTKVFNIGSSGTYEIGGTAIAASNLSNGVTGTGSVVLAAGPTISGTLTLSGSTTGIAELNGSGAVSSAPFGSNGTYLESLGSTTTWNNPAGSGTVNSGASNQAAYYTTSGTTVSGAAMLLTTSGSDSALTNAYYDTAGANNIFKVNGTAVSAVSGTGAVALVGSPTFTGTLAAAAITASGVVTGGAFISPPTVLSISTTTYTPVAVNTNTYRVVLTSACPCLIANPSGSAVDGDRFLLEIWQPATSASKTVTWGNLYDFGTAGSPLLSTVTGAGDALGFSYSGQDSKYLYLGIQQGF